MFGCNCDGGCLPWNYCLSFLVRKFELKSNTVREVRNNVQISVFKKTFLTFLQYLFEFIQPAINNLYKRQAGENKTWITVQIDGQTVPFMPIDVVPGLKPPVIPPKPPGKGRSSEKGYVYFW